MSTITEQQVRALERANEVKEARHELKRRIRRGDLFAASVLLDPPAEAENWPVRELVKSQPRWGPKTMSRVLARLEIPESKPVGRLTERQRRVLARALGWQEEER